MADLGGSQITALLESVPGIANVLRSPVADAIVSMIRAGAEIGPFHNEDAEELVQYAVRRGLISAREGDEVMADVHASAKGKNRTPKPKRKLPKPIPRGPFGRPRKPVGKPMVAKPVATKAPARKAPPKKKAAAKKAAKPARAKKR
ncbi:MAG: hypothetical protein WD934_11660 [Gemmatimonadales bacterium]